MPPSTNDDQCPVCGRVLGNTNVSKHHWIPKSKGGKQQELIHDICHMKIHSVFTNSQLEHEYSDPEVVRQHPDMATFIKWVSRKPPEYCDTSKRTTARRARGKYS